MIDIKTHRVIDLIPSHNLWNVTAWLKEYSGLRVISRDGSIAYASAIQAANSEIIQISDRFHLIKGLGEACKKQIQILVNANFRMSKTVSHSEIETKDTKYREKKRKPDVVTREQEKNLHKKQELVERVRNQNTQGVSQLEIASELGISRTSVWGYLKSSFCPASASYDQKHASKIKPYEKTIKKILEKRHMFKEIEQRLRESGYNGALHDSNVHNKRAEAASAHKRARPEEHRISRTEMVDHAAV